MNPFSFQSRLVLAAGLCLLPLSLALASPGAHGPNGEHLDGPATVAASSGLPRIEAHSEQFEIVGRLEAAGLVLYVSRYESNEAVLGGQLDVELGNLKASAAYPDRAWQLPPERQEAHRRAASGRQPLTGLHRDRRRRQRPARRHIGRRRARR